MEIGTIARKFRVAIQKLATAVEVYNRRLTVDELFQLTASTTPSGTGRSLYGWVTCTPFRDDYLDCCGCHSSAGWIPV